MVAAAYIPGETFKFATVGAVAVSFDKSILSIEDKFTSLIIGLSLRFAMAACAGLPDLLDNLKMDLTEKQLKVSFNKNTKSLLVDHVYEKLNILSNYLERELIIEL